MIDMPMPSSNEMCSHVCPARRQPRSARDRARLIRAQVVPVVPLQLLADVVEALVELLVVLVPGRVQTLEAGRGLALPGAEQVLHLAVELLELCLDLRHQVLRVLCLRLQHLEIDSETTTLRHRCLLPTVRSTTAETRREPPVVHAKRGVIVPNGYSREQGSGPPPGRCASMAGCCRRPRRATVM